MFDVDPVENLLIFSEAKRALLHPYLAG